MPRRGSTWAAPMPRGCSGACCATNGWPPRATASASSRRSSARSSSRPASRTPTSGSGSTRYYADIAPTAAKVLRFLLMLPGGNKTEGLAQMLRARNGGRLLQGEADYQLHLVYLWYERQPARALELLRGLQQHYPGNPLFPAQIADIQDTYLHDVTASLDSWRALLALAREQARQPLGAGGSAGPARRGAAARAAASDRPCDRAAAGRGRSRSRRRPTRALAQAHLRLGEAHDRLGCARAAVAAYRSAAAARAAGRSPQGARARGRSVAAHAERARRRSLSPVARRLAPSRRG